MHFSVPTSLAHTLREHGLRERRGSVTVRYLPDESFRYSAVLSRRQGNSPARNRMKRILREVMRTGAGAYPNGSYLVYVYGQCKDLDRGEIVRSLDSIMRGLKNRAPEGRRGEHS
jgi:ribonuclease P protein component